jgi:hypothetical protein
MATTPEGKVKAKIKGYLDSLGVWHFSPPANGFGRSGIPDLVCCYKGRFIGIEVKAPGKTRNTTTMQDREIAAINAAGGTALVVDDVSQVRYIFEGS